MNGSQQKQLVKQLQDTMRELEQGDDLGRDSQSTVTLDQQSVGRLSRMDAMQQQAMARATQQRRQNHKTRIIAALERIAQGEFGFCQTCGDEISVKRLELDPTVANCISCATA